MALNPDPEIYLRRGRDSFRVRVVAEILQDVELDHIARLGLPPPGSPTARDSCHEQEER